MSDHIPNSFQTPNITADQYMARLTSDEYKCLSYAIRRTLGFNRSSARISIKEFSGGKLDQNGNNLDYGTGLAEATCRACVKSLVKFKLLVITAPHESATMLPPEYAFQLDSALVDVAGLDARWEASKAAQARKMARVRNPDPTSVPHNQGATSVAHQGGTPVAHNGGTPVAKRGPGLSHRGVKETQLNPGETQKKPNQDEIRKHAEEVFTKLTGLQPIGNKTTLGTRWWTPLRSICKLCEWDKDRITQVMEMAHKDMTKRTEPLDITAPQSMEGYCNRANAKLNGKNHIKGGNGASLPIPGSLAGEFGPIWTSIPLDMQEYIIKNPGGLPNFRAALIQKGLYV